MSPESGCLTVHCIPGNDADAVVHRAQTGEVRHVELGSGDGVGGIWERGEYNSTVDAFRGEGEAGAELGRDGARPARWAGAG